MNEFKAVETVNIQMYELEKFAVHLGFEFNPESLNFQRFAGLKNKLLRAHTVISASTMVKMFNDGHKGSNHELEGNWIDVYKYSIFDLDGTGEGIAFFKEDVQKAYMSQRILQVKLQFRPKTKETVVLSDMIQFYEEDESRDFQKIVEEYEKLIAQEVQEEEDDKVASASTSIEKSGFITGRLENWYMDPVGRNIIWGEIYGDKKGRFVDGAEIHTSDILDGSEIGVGKVIVTRNSSYLLGEPLMPTM